MLEQVDPLLAELFAEGYIARALALGLHVLHGRADALRDDLALPLSHTCEDIERQPACSCGGVNLLRHARQVSPFLPKIGFDEHAQIPNVARESVELHHHERLRDAAGDALQGLLQAWALKSLAADALVRIHPDKFKLVEAAILGDFCALFVQRVAPDHLHGGRHADVPHGRAAVVDVYGHRNKQGGKIGVHADEDFSGSRLFTTPRTRSPMRPSKLTSMFCVLSLITALCACGEDASTTGDAPFEEVELTQIQDADQSVFDVQWKAGVAVAQAQDVLNDVEDLQAVDGDYRVANDSALLDGLEVGDVVVWPQLGVFRILSIEQGAANTQVKTEWATLAEAVDSADISFEHSMSQGEDTRALGVLYPEDETPASEPGVSRQAMKKKGGPKLTKDGAEYESADGNTKAKIAVGDEKVSLDFELTTKALTTKATVDVTGLKAEGGITYNAERDTAPSMRLEFKNIKVKGSMEGQVKSARGSVKLKPKTSMVFPFMLGPVPAFISVELVVEIEAGIREASAQLKTGTTFELDGEILLQRTTEGDLDVTGRVKSFKTPKPDFQYEIKFSSGIRVAVDAPKVSFGFGRPGIASASVFGTASAELVSNIAYDPLSKKRCTSLSTGSAVQAGGEVTFLGLKSSKTKVLVGGKGYKNQEGALCK